MLASPASAATSHATRCSLRGTGDGNLPLRQSPRAPTPPLRATTVTDHGHVSLGKPPAALLTTQDTSYDPAAHSLSDNYISPSAACRGHTKALSAALLDNCRPLVHRAASSLSHLQQPPRSSLPSPTKSLASFVPSRRDAAPVPDEQRPPISGRIGDWFNGYSAPFQFGRGPSDEDSESDIGSDSDLNSDDDFDRMDPVGYTRPPVGRARSVRSVKRASTQSCLSTTSQPPAPPVNSGFLSWFTRKPGAAKADPNMPQDPLSVLDIESALFPNGQPDPLDPASFHDLHKSSIALLQQFQASYKAITLAMQDTRLEEDGLLEEKKQAEVYAQNLEMQLANLKAESEKREKEMTALREALEREKQLRADEEEARIASLRAVRGPGCKCNRKSASTITSEPSGVLSDRDSGFESEGETLAADDLDGLRSPISRPISMVSESDVLDREIQALSSTENGTPTSTPATSQATTPTVASSKSGKPAMMKRKSTFDAALQKKREQRSSKVGNMMPIILTGANKLNNDNGNMDVVWRENRELRERVEHLERTVEETLGIVSGLEAGIIY